MSSNGYILALIAALGVGFLVQSFYLAHRLRHISRQRNRAVDALSGDVRALFDSAVGLGERLNNVERQLRAIEERQDQIDLKEPSYQSYGQAIRLVKNGADVDQLIANCDITRGEAELIAMFHRMAHNDETEQ